MHRISSRARFAIMVTLIGGTLVISAVRLGSGFRTEAAGVGAAAIVSDSPGPAAAPNTPSSTTSIFLAGVEQFSLGSGQIDLFNVTLGGNTAGSDTFAPASPATLATTTSTNEGKPDINNPVDLRFDKSGDLLIANGGTSNADPGSFACVPAGAVTTGANSSTTITQTGTNPTAFGFLAYDPRDGSAAIANNPVSSSTQLFEYLLSGSYSAATAPRNLVAPGFGATAVTEVPSLAAGTYAVALQTGAEEDSAHAGTTGTNKVAVFAPTGVRTDLSDDTNFSIDVPYGLAFDGQNNQLAISNFSTWHRLLSFYNLAATPPTLVKTINTTFRNTYTAASPDGHVAVAWVKQFGYMQVQVYDNTPARNPVLGPIPYNGTTTSCGSTYIYGNGTAIVTSLRWLSNTKLLVGVESNNSGTPTAKNGFYIYDITNSQVPAGFDDITCSAFAAAPINTGFTHINLHPFGAAVRSGTFAFADPAGTCSGNLPCFTTISAAITAASAGGVVNIFGGTYNEAVVLNNANVTVNVDANATVNSFTLTAGTLNAGGGFCAQANGPTLTLANGNWTNSGGTFNAGGGTIAMAGSSAQTIGGSNATTFNNLTINNASGVTQNTAGTVNGTLTLTNGAYANGANLTLGNSASIVRNNSGAPGGSLGSVPTFGTAVSVSYTGNTAITTGAELPVSSTVLGNLTVNDSGGVTLNANSTVNGALSLQSGAFGIASNTLTLNGAVASTGGSITSAATGTVIYNQPANGQAVLAANYGILTLNNFNKTLPAGTVGISGAFNPGSGTATITGNTVDFNGFGAETIPAFNYNNLTSSSTGGRTLASSGTIGVAGTFTPGGGNAYTVAGSTINFNGAAQTIPGFTYNDLTTAGSATKTLGGAVTTQADVTIGSGTTLAVGGSNFQINVGGNWTNNGAFTQGTGTVVLNGSGSQTVGGSNATTFNNLTLSNTTQPVAFSTNTNANGNLSVSANATLSPAAATLIGGSGTLTGSGTVQVTRTAATPDFLSQYTITNKTLSGLTVDYNAIGAQTISAINYGNLTTSGPRGVNSITLPTGTIGVVGTFTPNATFAGGTYVLNASSVFDYNGIGTQTVTAFNYDSLTISGARAGNNVRLASSGTIGIAGTFSPTATFTGGVFINAGSTINFNGSSSQTIPAFAYNNLTSSSTGARTLASSGVIGIAGVFTAGTNAYTVTGSTIDFNGSAGQTIPAFAYNNLTSSSTGARTLASSGVIGIAGVFTPGTNAYTVTGSTIDFNGSAGQTIPAFAYNNLTTSSTGARTISAGISIGGIFTVGSNAFTLTGSTIDFNGSGAQTIPALNYNNLTSSGSGARTLAPSGVIGIAGTFTPGTNSYTLIGSTVSYNGGSAQTLPSTFPTYNNLTLNNAAGTTGFSGLTAQGLVDVATGTFTSDNATFGNVQIDGAGTLAGVSATTINVGGSWANSGTFTPNGDTVNFNGASGQTIGGTTAPSFNGLTINDPLGVTTSANTTVGGTLTLTNGALGIGTTTLTLNGPISFTSGTILSSATGTAKYNKVSNGQTIAPGTYGNLIFSDFTKTLASSGTIKIAGTFTTGPTGGHTVTGSTVEFNGASAQTLPVAFDTYNNLTVNNPSGITLGVNTSIGGILNLLNGNLTTGANTLSLLGGSTTSRTSGAVIGLMQKTFAAGFFAEPGTPDAADALPPPIFTFPVGTTTGYFPVDVTPTAGSTGSLAIQTFNGTAGVVPPLDNTRTLQRYWTVSGGAGITASIKFNYGPINVPSGTTINGTEANYKPQRVTGGVPTSFFDNCPSGTCVDQTNHFIFMPAVSNGSFAGNWTASELAPTAAQVAVSGRVLTADGQAIRGVHITLDDGTGHAMIAISNAFGYYRFDEVRSGGTYIMNATARGYTFTPRVMSVNDELTDVNLTALP